MVNLESIELSGFKSFGQKTKLIFDKELTVIVGPNGSGKSNIVDALLWALGERENKNLRIHKNEDLIFSNPEAKSKSGLAWIKLAIKDGTNTIEIKRKINREGLSLSFVGERKVPLKDLIEFLAKKKIGAKGLNIIRQGESEKFIQANSLERRILLENILGVKAYQIKKHQAQLKLNQTNQHLEQAKIAFSELAPRYRSLRWQLSRYEKKEEIEASLKEKEVEYLAKKYIFIRTKETKNNDLLKDKIIKEIKGLEKEKDKIDSLKQEKKGKLSLIKKEKESLVNKKESLVQKRNKLYHELGKIEGAVSAYESQDNKKQLFSKKEINSLLEKIKEAAKNLLNFEGKELKEKIISFINFIEKEKAFFLDINLKKAEKNKEKTEGLVEKENEIKNKLTQIENEEKEISANIASLNNNLNEAEKEYYQVWQKITKIQEEIFSKKNFLSQQESREAVLNERKKELKEEIIESGMSKSLIEEKAKNIELKEISYEELRNLKNNIFRLRSQVASIGQISKEFINEAKEVEKRYNFLKTEIEDLESAKEKLVFLIKDLEAETEKIFNSGIEKINNQLKKISEFIFPKGKIKLKNYKEQVGEEEKDILEIEIVWKNKTIRNINTLSGGEKTLIALAILTSIALSCQPPFIILDEVDASLDAENSKKIAEILEEISKYAQIILITHNQITAKSAKIIYGIIMSNGSSKIVSYKF